MSTPQHIIAIDTETLGLTGPPWAIQYSLRPGHGVVVFADNRPMVAKLGRVLAHPSVLTIVHNALFDLRVMETLGVRPHRVLDTMVMAYLLGESALSLKTLAYRYAGLEMRTYEEVVGPYSDKLSLPWLEKVAAAEWPDPEPVVEVKPDGTPHVRQPQNLGKRLGAYLRKHAKGEAKLNPVAYWNHKDREADREMVEPVFGPMPEATLADVPLPDATRYSAMDPDATMRIFHPLYSQIVEQGLEDVLERDMAVTPMVLEMMKNGMLVDREHFAALGRELTREIDRLQERIDTVVGAHLNPRSPLRVVEELMRLGLNIRSSRTEELDKHRNFELVHLVQDYRAASKLLSTYVDVLPKLADEYGRIHTSLSTTRTATGRMASSRPNLQNQPVRTEMGRKIRDGFVAGEGNSLLAFDLSQVELRAAAHVSGDDALISAYWDGRDIHTETACHMFGLPPEQIDRTKHRRPGKTCNFSIIYLISPPSLLVRFYHEDILEFTEPDCARFIRSWRDNHPQYFQWAEEVQAFAIRHGYVVDYFGRRRWIPELNSTDRKVREGGLKECVNTPIQSLAAGIIKEIMRRLCPRVMEYRRSGGVVLPILQVHDELIFEVEDGLVDLVAGEFAPVFEHSTELAVPLEVGIKYGKRWGSMREYER